MRARTGRRGMPGIILLVTCLAFGLIGCGVADSDSDWQSIRERLADSRPTSVRMEGNGPKELKELTVTGSDADLLKEYVRDGAFSEDNAARGGGTPTVIVIFRFADSPDLVLAQWPDRRFQIQTDHNQFLITAPELASFLARSGFDPTR